jgi:lysophospholipase L1-like esterase
MVTSRRTQSPFIMKTRWTLIAFFVVWFLAGCTVQPVIQPTNTPAPTHTATFTSTPSRTATALPTPTEKEPLTLVFYGDSTLKVGEVGRQGQVGFSFVDNLRTLIDPGYNVITANYGGKSAQWAYNNLEQSVLSLNPDVVTLEWGWDDLHGCSGIFERDTNSLVEYKLVALINVHIKYLKLQIDALLDHGIAVFVITPLPINGGLPWSYYGPNNEIITESDYWCNYNIGVEQLVEAQRQLVIEYTAEQNPVFLVDAWQIYKDHPNEEKMYMDIPHPGSYGAQLIAEGWLQAFRDSQIH